MVRAEVPLWEVAVEREFGVLREGGRPRNRWGVPKWELEIKEQEMRLEEQVLGSNAVRARPVLLSSF